LILSIDKEFDFAYNVNLREDVLNDILTSNDGYIKNANGNELFGYILDTDIENEFTVEAENGYDENGYAKLVTKNINFIRPKFTVKFNKNNENATITETERSNVSYGSVINDLPQPIRNDGYEFTGWTINGVNINNGTNLTLSNFGVNFESFKGSNFELTLTANYQGKTVEKLLIIHKNDDNTLEEEIVSVSNVRVGDVIEVNNYAKNYDGYVVDLNGSYTIVSGENIVEVNYNKIVYTLKFYDKETELSFADYDNSRVIGNTYGNGKDLPTPPVKDGYTFDYWRDAQNLEITKDTEFNIENVDLYAVWTNNTYTINYELNGGSNNTAPTSATFDEAFELSNPTKVGYTFNGWDLTSPNKTYAKSGENSASVSSNFTDGTKHTFFMNLTISGSVTLTANWVVNNYTVTFNNGGADGSENMNPVDFTFETENITIPDCAFSYTGKYFNGWVIKGTTKNVDVKEYSKEELLTKLGIGSPYISKTIELVATWEYITYKVNTIVDGIKTTSYNAIYNQNLTNVVKPEKDGYSFVGWVAGVYNNEGLLEKDVNFNSETAYAGGNQWSEYNTPQNVTSFKNLTINNNVEVNITAVWESETYTVTVNLNGGKVEYNSTEHTANFDITNVEFGETEITLNNPTKPGYTFDGWTANGLSNEALAGGSSWEDGTEPKKETIFKNLTTGGSVTLTANWTVNKYNVTIEYNNGTDDETFTKNFTDEFTLTEPTKVGYEFTGWTVTANTGTDLYSERTENPYSKLTVTNNGSVKITATWKVNNYKLTFYTQGGTELDAVEFDFEDEDIVISEPTKVGYTFSKWTLDAVGNTETTLT
ncbi:MAG: InlB B-repeat-containing protein, partial [Clostridia bacterium]|nr:InlB B-repeat-containing protein [Clostridia bacterium]